MEIQNQIFMTANIIEFELFSHISLKEQLKLSNSLVAILDTVYKGMLN